MNQHINNGAAMVVTPDAAKGSSDPQLKTQDRSETAQHNGVYRPWGSYEGIGQGERYQVKRIRIRPGASLSLQIHHHRAEHWVVVRSTAMVQRGREYGKLVTGLTQFIADLQGFYLWGRYENYGLWQTIYLGKAGFGRTTSLRARITEELKDERPLIWCGKHTGLDDKAVKELWHLPYPPSPDNKAGINHANRALRKAGSTHIIWVATPEIDNGDVARIEADLIETLNPSANVQRPAPSSGLQGATVSVVQQLKAEMHRHRPKGKAKKAGQGK